MHDLYIQAVRTEEPGSETPASARERLKPLFPPGTARRMTHLGMLMGAVLSPLSPCEDDAIVYMSQFGESRTLEAYLDSFPTASPLQFQTSIHPSGVQQLFIGRHLAVGQLYPLAGDRQLVAQGLLTAALTGASRTLLCGGEERGSWLLECDCASSETFAFAVALTSERGEGAALGKIRLERGPLEEGLSLRAWARLLHSRSAYSGPSGSGWRLTLEWF